MAFQNEAGLKAFLAATALVAFSRVKLSGGSGGDTVALAGLGEDCIGITQHDVDAAGQPVTVALKNAGRTFKLIAAEAFAAGVGLYGAATGQVSDAANGALIGTALTGASGAGSIIEGVLNNGSSASFSGAGLQPESDGVSAVPFIIEKSFADAATGDTAIPAQGFKFRVIGFEVENHGANGSNANTVQLCAAAAGASPISNAVSLNGSVDKAVVAATSIDYTLGIVTAAQGLFLARTRAGGVLTGVARIKAVRVA